MKKPLFRQEAIDKNAQRLYGDIVVLPQLSHVVITVFLVAWVLVVLYWLITSSYARKETVLGWLEPSEGVVRIYPPHHGKIDQVFIDEGDYIKEGQTLFSIDTTTTLVSGASLEDVILQEFLTQEKLLKEQLNRINQHYKREEIFLEKKQKLAQKELILLQDQYNTLDQEHQLLTKKLQKIKNLKSKNYISQQEYDSVIQEELSVRGRRQEISRLVVNKEAKINELNFDLQSLPREADNANANIQQQLSDLEQQQAQTTGKSFQSIKSPIDGIVNNLQITTGYYIDPDNKAPLLTLLPDNKQLLAHLLVPTRSIGFVETGQQLAIRYDAFPHQKFGLYKGRIENVAESILLPKELLSTPVSTNEPVYQVIASIDTNMVEAYGSEFALRPGMTLNADITLSERTLMKWLLEPLYSLRGRR